MRITEKKLFDKSVVVVTHYYGTGPGEALRDYLPDKVANFFWLGYPLFQGKPIIQITDNSKQKTVKENRWFGMPEVIRYCYEVLNTIKQLIKTGQSCDLYIGIDSLNALAGIILKRLGRVKKVAFYTIDFVPQRFNNPLLNALYHRIDRFCVENADITWNLSARMAEGREKVSGYPRKLREKQMELPIGVWWSRIKPKKAIGNRAIFVGHITEKQGVQVVIDAIPEITKAIPNFHLDVAGDGPYRSTLEEQVKRLGLSKYVTFHGFIKKDQDVEKMVSRSALTLALYRKENDPFTYYADPGKLKVYLASGVPVLLTDLPAIARKIERAKAGLLVKYDHHSVARAIITLLKNPKELRNYRANARAFAKQFDWPTIFEKALRSVI